jgi:hypothetical protein
LLFTLTLCCNLFTDSLQYPELGPHPDTVLETAQGTEPLSTFVFVDTGHVRYQTWQQYSGQ